MGGGRWEVGVMIEQEKRGESRRDDIVEGEKGRMAGQKRRERKKEVGEMRQKRREMKGGGSGNKVKSHLKQMLLSSNFVWIFVGGAVLSPGEGRNFCLKK